MNMFPLALIIQADLLPFKSLDDSHGPIACSKAGHSPLACSTPGNGPIACSTPGHGSIAILKIQVG